MPELITELYYIWNIFVSGCPSFHALERVSLQVTGLGYENDLFASDVAILEQFTDGAPNEAFTGAARVTGGGFNNVYA